VLNSMCHVGQGRCCKSSCKQQACRQQLHGRAQLLRDADKAGECWYVGARIRAQEQAGHQGQV